MNVVAKKKGRAIDPVLLLKAKFHEAGNDVEALLSLVDELGGLGGKEARTTLSATEVRERVSTLRAIVDEVIGQEPPDWRRVSVELCGLPAAYDFRKRIAEALGVADQLLEPDHLPKA